MVASLKSQMTELKIAPSTIEVGGKTSVELAPFELRNRDKRKQDFTEVVGAIASGNPEKALEYEAEYGLEDDFAEDQEAIQTFVALQQAANGDKNAAMSLFNSDSELRDSISRLRAGPDPVKQMLDSDPQDTTDPDPQNTTPVEQFSYYPSEEDSYSTDFFKLSRQGLAYGGLPQTVPVDFAYLNLLRSRSGLSPAAQAGIGAENIQRFSPSPVINRSSLEQPSAFQTAEQVGAVPDAPAGRTSAGATLAAIAPSLATGAIRGNVDFGATALGQLGRAGPNTNTAVGAFSNLGAVSKAVSNANLDLTNMNTVAGVANLGMNAANTISNLSNFDISAIPGEIQGLFGRAADFVQAMIDDPMGTINSAMEMAGTSIAYGPDITAPVAVAEVPGQPFAFDAKSLEVSTNPGFLSALFAMAPTPMGLTSRLSDLAQNRDINQLSDFSKAASYQAWDMVSAHTAGQLGISDHARGAYGISALGVGFSGKLSATVNNINVTFDPFAENPVNTITSFIDLEHQSTHVDPLELDRERQEINAAVEFLSGSLKKGDPDSQMASFNYANTLADLLDASFDRNNTMSFSAMDLDAPGNPSYSDPTDLAAADYGAATKEAADKARADWEAGKITSLEYAINMSTISNTIGRSAQIGLGFAKGTIGQIATPAFGTAAYYSAAREKEMATAVGMSAAGEFGPGSFSAIGENIAEDYNSQSPSPTTIDIMDRAGLNQVSVSKKNTAQFDLLGRTKLNSFTNRGLDFSRQSMDLMGLYGDYSDYDFSVPGPSLTDDPSFGEFGGGIDPGAYSGPDMSGGPGYSQGPGGNEGADDGTGGFGAGEDGEGGLGY